MAYLAPLNNLPLPRTELLPPAEAGPARTPSTSAPSAAAQAIDPELLGFGLKLAFGLTLFHVTLAQTVMSELWRV